MLTVYGLDTWALGFRRLSDDGWGLLATVVSYIFCGVT